jgi:hypothetical protein
MAEEKAEKNEEKKKTPGVARQVFKWLGLGVVCVLLLGAVVFAAPWKVTTVLVIILAAGTVLPKPARKWFWAGVGVIVIALIVWVFLPESDGDWRPYTFDDELAALEAKRAIPYEENAARIYNQLLDNYDSNSFYLGLTVNEVEKIMREPWLSRENPQIAEWLETHQTTINALLNAATIEKCRFAINADVWSISDTMDRRPPMRKWAYLLISGASNDIAEGRSEEGLEKLVAVLQMGNHQRQHPACVDFLGGAALESLSMSQFRRFLVDGNATDEHVSVIQKALGAIKYDWSNDFPRFIKYEKLYAKNIWGLFYGVSRQGKIQLGRSPMIGILTGELLEDVENKRFMGYLYKGLTKFWTIFCWFYMPSDPQRVGAIVEEVYERFYTMAEPDYDWQKTPAEPSRPFRLNYEYLVESTTEMLAPLYHEIHDKHLQSTAAKQGSEITVALRHYKNEHSSWPGSLGDIRDLVAPETFIDPINGGSFEYRLTEDNFILYSKGKNGVDDGGKWDGYTGADDRLIWPPKSRKAKEEDTDG